MPRNIISISSHRVVVSALIGGAVLGLTQLAGAFASNTSVENPNGESCAYTQQLLSSVEARREYLVRLDQALGGVYAGNAVEEMYGNIVPAAVSEEDDESYGGGRRSIGSLFSKARSNKPLPTLDSFSADCVSCHDGVGASAIGVDLRDRPFGRRPQVVSFESDHPIGMTYNSYVGARKGFKVIKPGTKMLFVDGKVGCLTCHDPLSQEKGRLVMSDRRSALCLTCHDK